MLKSVKEVESIGKTELTLAPKDVDTMDAQITEAESVMHPNVGVMEISKETSSTLVSSADSSHTVEVVSSKPPIESCVEPPLSALIMLHLIIAFIQVSHRAVQGAPARDIRSPHNPSSSNQSRPHSSGQPLQCQHHPNPSWCQEERQGQCSVTPTSNTNRSKKVWSQQYW